MHWLTKRELTYIFIVLGFVLLATEESSGCLFEEALGWTGNVEVWGRMAAADRQSFWHEALRRNHDKNTDKLLGWIY